jgi:hypothetical protein
MLRHAIDGMVTESADIGVRNRRAVHSFSVVGPLRGKLRCLRTASQCRRIEVCLVAEQDGSAGPVQFRRLRRR